MSLKRQRRYCAKCKQQTQHALDHKGRTCEVCKTFTSKAEDAVNLYDVSGKLKR